MQKHRTKDPIKSWEKISSSWDIFFTKSKDTKSLCSSV